MGAEIPVWVGGLQKWVTGLTKKTTCEDIVRVLLRSEGRPIAEEKDWRHYVIVERWRRVERPLDAATKISKVWRAWGEEQANVRLTLKRMPANGHSSTAASASVGRSNEHREATKSSSSSRKRSNPKLWRQQQAAKTSTMHPRKLLLQQQHDQQHQMAMLQDREQRHHGDMDGRITNTMERLMKVIIAQGETIQAQLRRLQEKDDQIDQFEHQMHATRVEELGENYLVDTYLGGDAQSRQPTTVVSRDSATSCVTVATTENAWRENRTESEEAAEEKDANADDPGTVRDVRRCVRHYERFLALCERLEREEEAVLWLSAQLSQRQKQQLQESGESGSAISEIMLELEAMQGRVERLSVLNVANDADIRDHEMALHDLGRLLDDKECYVGMLERDLSVAERETETLQSLRLESSSVLGSASDAHVVLSAGDDADIAAMMSGGSVTMQAPSGGVVMISEKDQSGDTDSNSDTGLSSLHSSSDDGAYGLDTLV